MTFSHSDLVDIAEKWLSKKCGFVFKEFSSFAGEIPDAIGFRSRETTIVECKVSRSDFFSDSSKYTRRNPEMGVGKYRFFMCATGLIHPSELPERWGLLYVNDKGKVRQKVGPTGNDWSKSEFVFSDRNIEWEMDMTYTALRRLNLRGVISLIYDRRMF